MELRELKKEAHRLSDINENLKLFRENWLRPLRETSNRHLPFLKELDEETKKELNWRLHTLKSTFDNLQSGQMLNDKLKDHAHDLIELKLTTFNGDRRKSEVLTNQFLNDDCLNIKQTIREVQEFSDDVQELSVQYQEINELLQKKLSLEEVIFYLDLPHKLYIYNLSRTAQKQKTIVRELGRHFVSIIRENKKRS